MDKSATLSGMATVRPELRLLICCARTAVGPELSACLRDLLGHAINWDYLIDSADRHGVMPLLYRSLAASNDERIPDHALKGMRKRYLANSGRNIQLVMELLQILELLEQQGLPVVPIKGPALAVSVYGNLSLRQFCDLDILVHQRHAIAAKKVINARRYVNNFGLGLEAEAALIRYQKDFQLISNDRKFLVELHWSFEPGKRFQSFSDDNVWQRLIPISLEGKSVQSLSPEDTLMYLCLHGASHCWDRLGWICDLAETIRRFPSLDWDLVGREIRKLRSLRTFFLGLELARTLLDAPVPRQLAIEAAAYPQVAELRRQVIDRILKNPEDSMGLFESFSFRMAVRESISNKARFFLQRFVIPDAVDFRSTSLPPGLFFLLPLVRPFRLFSKHAR